MSLMQRRAVSARIATDSTENRRTISGLSGISGADILQRLADTGNTVIVIEHNLDVIKCADYIIDLGPEGGEKGGTVVATGTPEEVAKCKNSYTGQYLKGILKV